MESVTTDAAHHCFNSKLFTGLAGIVSLHRSPISVEPSTDGWTLALSLGRSFYATIAAALSETR